MRTKVWIWSVTRGHTLKGTVTYIAYFFRLGLDLAACHQVKSPMCLDGITLWEVKASRLLTDPHNLLFSKGHDH